KRCGDARAIRYNRAVVTRRDGASPIAVPVSDRVSDAGATGLSHEFRTEPNKATRRHDELHAHPAGAVVHHVFHAALAGSKQLRDRTEVLFRRVDREVLERLLLLAVDLLDHHLWLADGEFESFTPHVLDENCERKLTTTLHLPGVGAVGVKHLQRHVTDELAVEAIFDHARSELVALHLA